MNGREIISDIMEQTGVSKAEMAKRLGITPATMWARLNSQNKKDIPLTTFCDMLDKLGFDVVVKQREVPVVKPIEHVVTVDEEALEEHRGGARFRTPTPGLENESAD